MAGSNNFLVFDEDKENIMSDADYGASSTRTGGLSTGIAQRNLHNKLFRQVSVMAAAIGQFIANMGYVASDEDDTALASAFGSSVLNPGTNNKSIQETKTLLIDTDTRSVEITRSGGQITGMTVKDPADSSTVESIAINRTGGLITSLIKTVGSRTITYTPARTGGQITGITKGVA